MNANTSSLAKLTTDYINAAVESLTRRPSPSLTSPEFRATLHHWSELSRQALAGTKTPGKALIAMVHAEASANVTPTAAIRLLQQVMRQVLWRAAVDVDRAENPHPRDPKPVQPWERLDTISNPPPSANGAYGDTDQSPDLPTADEARDALVEANGWLSALADLLFDEHDMNGREFYRLSDGLEYTSRAVISATGDTLYIPVHNADEALELQIELNQRSRETRLQRRVQARADAFAKLAELMG